MRIVILGAGHLGYTIAELLSNEQHDVVVADSDEEKVIQSPRLAGCTYDHRQRDKSGFHTGSRYTGCICFRGGDRNG